MLEYAFDVKKNSIYCYALLSCISSDSNRKEPSADKIWKYTSFENPSGTWLCDMNNVCTARICTNNNGKHQWI